MFIIHGRGGVDGIRAKANKIYSLYGIRHAPKANHLKRDALC
jgi:hypothetical protein